MQKAQRVNIESATRVTASIIGVYAGLLGMAHGYYETLQGVVAPNGIGINAIGAPCQGELVWHACLPAMTIVPNFFVSGILTIIVSLTALVWAARFIQQKHGSLILILLSILMLLVGGGFIPPFTSIIASAAGAGINAQSSFFRTHISGTTIHFLAKLWRWVMIAFVVWSFGGWILGYYFNQMMIDLSFILFFFCNLGLPLLAVFTGFSWDLYNCDHAVIER
jgi:hypothetical protein